MTYSFSVSVIIPAHNAAPFLAQAVASAMRQHHPLEIIIIDDGSTDDTITVAQGQKATPDSRIHVLSQPQAGPAAARNRGLEKAQGDIIGFLDADDLWPEDSVRCRLAPLQDRPDVSGVMGRARLMRMSEAGAGEPQGEGEGAGEVSGVSFLSPLLGSALFRRSAFDTIGGFDPGLRYGEDLDWFLRAREQGLFLATVTQTTLLYRRHPANMTRGKSMTDLKVVEVLKRSLDRRRRDSGVAQALPDIMNVERSVL